MYQTDNVYEDFYVDNFFGQEKESPFYNDENKKGNYWRVYQF